MKKVAETLHRMHVECPFCGRLCDRFSALSWCSGCFVEWYRDRKGRYVFDDRRKTPRFAVAKAVNKAGGVKIA